MSWLEGVECMQPDDWTPTPDQWKMIRETIGNLKPEVIEKPIADPSLRAEAALPAMHQASPVMHQAPLASAFERMPQQKPTQQRLMPSALRELPPAAPGVPAATVKRKDQVLDTSNGDYTSEFV